MYLQYLPYGRDGLFNSLLISIVKVKVKSDLGLPRQGRIGILSSEGMSKLRAARKVFGPRAQVFLNLC